MFFFDHIGVTTMEPQPDVSGLCSLSLLAHV